MIPDIYGQSPAIICNHLALLNFTALIFQKHRYFFNKTSFATTITAQKMKFSINDSITFTEDILNRKLHFLCSECFLFHNSLRTSPFSQRLLNRKLLRAIQFDLVAFRVNQIL